jgi:hypothetical protein
LNLTTMFADPPRSTRHFAPGVRAAAYLKPPTSSLDWAGADWKYPTALDFEKSIMTAETYGEQVVYGNERQPVHPLDLIQDLASMWQRTRKYLDRKRYVVDADERLGVTIHGDFLCDTVMFQIRVKCWPAIEGVTTPRRDVTR